MFDPDFVVPFLVFSIPIIAVTGGIVAGIVKSIGRQRLAELAQRERIAAIERGIDPTKLPALIPPAGDDQFGAFHPYGTRHRAQGLLVGGIITLFAGLGVSTFLMILKPDGSEPIWAVGLIPAFVGFAMLISSWIVWPRDGSGPPR
jgi:hypothetical protein